METRTDKERKKIYFASDFHLGIPDYHQSLQREKMLVEWLDEVSRDAIEIFLMGDVFDFWFEYKTVVPKGYVRLLGKIAEMSEMGIHVHLFTGNHDIWAFNYLEKELNIQIHRKPEIRELLGKQFYLAHGDGLGPGDHGYKILKKVFSNRLNQWLFKWLHPDIGAAMALYFSRKSRLANVVRENRPDFVNSTEDLMLYKYAVEMIRKGLKVDFFIFGHIHTPTNIELENGSRLIILGDWLTNFTYAEFDGNLMDLKYIKK